MTKQTNAPTRHAKLSASGAKKWIHCAGVIAAEAGQSDDGSSYADEGSAAHLFASQLLDSGADAISLIGTANAEWAEYPMTAEMAPHVQTYVDYVRSLWAFCDETWNELERFIDPKIVKLPEGEDGKVGGTSDAGGIEYATKTLHVTDLKYGKGVLVEVDDNEQLMIYGLSAFLSLAQPLRQALQTIKLHIVQPRAFHEHGPIRTVEFNKNTLCDWGHAVLGPAAFAALEKDAKRTAGDWCTTGFCKARRTCPTFRDAAFESTPFTFHEVGAGLTVPESVAAAAFEMTPERVTEIYGKLGLLEQWVKDFRAFVFAELDAGRPLPGLALKRGQQGNRKWLDEAMAKGALEELGISPFDTPSIVSVTTAEKLCKVAKKPLPEHLVTRSEGALSVCAADDPKALPAPRKAESHFDFGEHGL